MRIKLTTNDIKAGIKMNNNFFTAWIHKNTNAKDWNFNVGNDLWPPPQKITTKNNGTLKQTLDTSLCPLL